MIRQLERNLCYPHAATPPSSLPHAVQGQEVLGGHGVHGNVSAMSKEVKR